MINGVNVTEAILMSPADRRRAAREAAALGATHVRVEIPWQVVQPTPDRYDWAACDDLVTAFTEAGLKLCVILGVHRASWQTFSIPAQFGQMCSVVANRYIYEGVDTWEIWNEQNNALYWNASSFFGYFNSGPKATEYVPYLKAAYTEIHRVQPKSTVLFGGMAANLSYSTWLHGLVSRDPVDYLRDCYTAGAKGFFDGLSYHPYPMNDSFSLLEVPSINQKFIARIELLRQVMAEKKDLKPIHLTEWGFDYGQFTETQCDVYTVGQYAMHSQFTNVASNYLYSLRDWAPHKYGLLRTDWTPRPAHATVKRLFS